MIKIDIPTSLREITKTSEYIELEASSAVEAIGRLVEKYPALSEKLYDTQGKLNKYIRLYLNEEMLEPSSHETTSLGESDVISVIIPVAGG